MESKKVENKCNSELGSVSGSTARPPLGLMPRVIVEHLRIIEIVEACNRYAESHKKIPEEWIRELAELNSYIKPYNSHR